MLYQIYHSYDIDDGFESGRTSVSDVIAVVNATQKEIDAFIKEWNQPCTYDTECRLWHHNVKAIPIKETKLSDIRPY